MNRLVTAVLFFFTTFCFADVAQEPWPESLRDFPEPGAHVVGGFRITVKEAVDQTAGGSGGAIYDIIVRSTHIGASCAVNDQCVGVRVLALFQGWPQLEIWGRAGGGYWSRTLYRRVKGVYKSVRTDEFTENKVVAKDKGRMTTMPKVETTLYFVETRLPEDG